MSDDRRIEQRRQNDTPQPIERRSNDRRRYDLLNKDERNDDTQTYLIRISEADRDMYARALRCYAMFVQFINENPMPDSVDEVDTHAEMLEALIEDDIEDGRINDFTA